MAVKKSKNRLWWFAVSCVVALGFAVAAFCLWRTEGQRSKHLDGTSSDVKQNPEQKGNREGRKIARPKSGTDKRSGKSANKKALSVLERKVEKPEIEVDDDDLSPAERKLKDAIEKALDDEDLASARAFASQALIADNTEIRQAMVNTLGWFGVKALPELTPFLADPDEDVRESAMNEWTTAVSEIKDEGEKLGVVELAMHVLTDDDALEEISEEYIGIDEKQAVESLLRVIESGGSKKGIAKAKETYEFVTGDEFVDRATTEKWIAEEYEPSAKD